MAVRQKSDFYERFMAEANERRALARRLRDEGKTFEEIGAALGVSRQRAFFLVRSTKTEVG